MKITVPDHLGELTIEQFQAIHNTDDPIEQVAIACGVTREFINYLDLASLEKVIEVMGKFDPSDDRVWPLVRTFEHMGVTYGFNPNLSAMTVGEYADLETICQDLYANLVAFASVLYRPVVFKRGDAYEITPYAGVEEVESFRLLRMEVILGALAFFLNFATDCAGTLSQSLMEREGASWVRSGAGMRRFTT